jgi:hypothetical protein
MIHNHLISKLVSSFCWPINMERAFNCWNGIRRPSPKGWHLCFYWWHYLHGPQWTSTHRCTVKDALVGAFAPYFSDLYPDYLRPTYLKNWRKTTLVRPSTFVHHVAHSTFQELNWSVSASDFDPSTQMIKIWPSFRAHWPMFIGALDTVKQCLLATNQTQLQLCELTWPHFSACASW